MKRGFILMMLILCIVSEPYKMSHIFMLEKECPIVISGWKFCQNLVLEKGALRMCQKIYLQVASNCRVKLAKSDNSVSKAELSQLWSLVYLLNNSNI
jgi:hypothetical protein